MPPLASGNANALPALAQKPADFAQLRAVSGKPRSQFSRPSLVTATNFTAAFPFSENFSARPPRTRLRYSATYRRICAPQGQHRQILQFPDLEQRGLAHPVKARRGGGQCGTIARTGGIGHIYSSNAKQRHADMGREFGNRGGGDAGIVVQAALDGFVNHGQLHRQLFQGA